MAATLEAVVRARRWLHSSSEGLQRRDDKGKEGGGLRRRVRLRRQRRVEDEGVLTAVEGDLGGDEI